METKSKEVIEVSIEETSTPNDMLSIPKTKPNELATVNSAAQELDFNDRTTIIHFGTSAQAQLDDISNRMIDGVKTKI